MTGTRNGSLQGLKVVDLSRVLAGPLCTQMLADHGAAVVKIEPPSGDETRGLGPPFDEAGNAAYFLALNRGKRSISLDLSRAPAQEILHRLLGDADILVENFLPGTMERWGLGYEQALAERYPKLIYCAVSGFGADGPLGGLPGYDAVLQALCGLMSINGDEASGATRMGIPIVDHLTGYVALSGILMALQARHRSGRGQRVEATLFDTAMSLLLPHASNFFTSRQSPQLLGSAHPNIAPYDKFRARDGDLFLGIVNDAQFRRFCSALDLHALPEDPRYASNSQRVQHRAELKQTIERAIAERDIGPLCEALMRSGVPAGAVNSLPTAVAHPHCEHRGLLVQEGSYVGLRSPMRLTGTPGHPGRRPPTFAQDTHDVLAELGYSLEEVEQLSASGVSRMPKTGTHSSQ